MYQNFNLQAVQVNYLAALGLGIGGTSEMAPQATPAHQTASNSSDPVSYFAII